MEFPQAPVEKELYLKTPKVFEIDTKGYISEHVLKVHKNVYEQKQYGRLWYQYLSRKITKEIGFTRSIVDMCVLYIRKTMYTLYTDKSILVSPDQE